MVSWIHQALAEADREEQAIYEPQAPPILAASVKVVQEIGEDPILAEAVLSWVRQKKRETVMAQLQTLYTPEQLQAMIDRANGGETK